MPIRFALPLMLAGSLSAQSVIDGRLHGLDQIDPSWRIPLTGVLAMASVPGSESEALSFRTWEMEPAGWFRLSGVAGRYTLAFTDPAHFMRPMVLTNQFVQDGEQIDLRLVGSFDYACFHDGDWDSTPARKYFQPFFARGTSITAAGIKLATDGVDGAGPGTQDVLISIHQRTEGDPEDWPQVGPTATVREVDCGGPKSYWYSAGWRSDEVPTEPGCEYAVAVQPARADGRFQTFWRPRRGGSPGVYRVGEQDRGYEPHDMWLAVSSDHDGLVIPYNKRVHSKFRSLTQLDRKWSQTWVAKGCGLASVVLYAAVSGKQPPLSRQRVRVQVRAGGPEGPVVGTGKIAVGNGNYTGDASWGHFVEVFAPGEVSLHPGQTYALEFESIETGHTVGGFVNIKNQVSDGRAGFNPYRKCEPDEYPFGTAYRGGSEAQDFDLDLQIVEYRESRERWEVAVAGPELLVNGGMELRSTEDDGPLAWRPFRLFPNTQLAPDRGQDGSGTVLLVSAANLEGKTDGGWVQQVSGLSRSHSYRLSGMIRATWPASIEHKCLVGIDPTGQCDDPRAASIRWTLQPGRHGAFLRHLGEAIRPVDNAASIWLRATSNKEDPRFPFLAEFDDFSLRRVDCGTPARSERTARAGFIDRIPPEPAAARDARLALVRARRAHVPVLVHRGASRFAPENTLQAFNSAMDRGADGFELDIRRSSDGALYVFHDDTLDRVTNGVGKVSGRTYFDLLEFELGGPGHRIPTLAAVFTLARDRGALLHLDVKEAGLEPGILRLIDEGDLWEHIVSVNPGHALSIRINENLRLLNYKGWFPDDAEAQSPFLKQPGEMVFTKWDPIPAVRALGRDEREPEPLRGYLEAIWEAEGPLPRGMNRPN